MAENDDLDRQYLDYIRERDARRDQMYADADARNQAANAALAENVAARSATESDRNYKLAKADIDLKRKQLLEVGIPEAKVNKWYREQQVQLAREQLMEDRRQFDVGQAEKGREFDVSTAEGQRQFNETLGNRKEEFGQTFGENKRQFDLGQVLDRERLGENARQFDLGLGLSREQLGENRRQFNASTGLDLVKTGASLTGPENVFAASDFARGVRDRADTPLFLKSLRDAGDVALAGGVDSSAPTANTLDSLYSRLGAGTASTGGGNVDDEAQRALGAITPIAMRPGKLQPGSIERLLPSEQKILGAGLGKVGTDANDWLSRYKQNSGLGFSWAA